MIYPFHKNVYCFHNFIICVIILITFLSYPSNYLQDCNVTHSHPAKSGGQHSHSAKGGGQHSHAAKGGAKQAEASGEPEIKKEKGIYVGIEEEDDHRTDTEDDGLGDIWKEMTMALECSKVL